MMGTICKMAFKGTLKFFLRCYEFNCISKLRGTIYLLDYGYFQFPTESEIKMHCLKL